MIPKGIVCKVVLEKIHDDATLVVIAKYSPNECICSENVKCIND